LLVITRKDGEGVWIGDAHVIVRVTDSGQVKLSIDAPATINIRRDELKERDANKHG
jgi:carbon storage regulator CsrA